MLRLAPEPSRAAAPLACVVASADDAHAAQLVVMLGRSARVDAVERATDEVALRHALAVAHRDLVVLVLGTPDSPLPRCLLRYPDTRVLVVAPDGVSGTLSRWLQQGANDLVSPHDEDALAHALGRMVDECALAAKVRRLEAELAALHRRVASAAEPLVHAPDERVDDGDASSPAADEPDTATRLPGRAATIAALQRLRSRRAGDPASPLRLTAVQVTLPGGNPHSGLDRALADLAACRAAAVLRRALPAPLVFGRTRRDTLLVVLAGGPGAIGGPDAAARLLAACGSLGELVERAGDLRVDTLGGTADFIATPTLPERLERRAHDALVACETLRGAAPLPDRPIRPLPCPGTPRAPRAHGARDGQGADESRTGTRTVTRYIGEVVALVEPRLDDSLVPILTQKSAGARFARPAAGA